MTRSKWFYEKDTEMAVKFREASFPNFFFVSRLHSWPNDHLLLVQPSPT